MKIWKHPLFWMGTNALVILYILNLNLFLDIDARMFESIVKVLLPMTLGTFVLLIVSFALQIFLDIYEKERKENGRKTISSNKRQEECNVYGPQGSDIQRRRPFIDEDGGIYISAQR